MARKRAELPIGTLHEFQLCLRLRPDTPFIDDAPTTCLQLCMPIAPRLCANASPAKLSLEEVGIAQGNTAGRTHFNKKAILLHAESPEDEEVLADLRRADYLVVMTEGHESRVVGEHQAAQAKGSG